MVNCFKRWGLPRSIKVDNGKPFGDPQMSSVPEMALWLIGLGMEVIWNPPRCPRENAKVERMQGTTACWAEVYACGDLERLQQALDKAGIIQREKYEVRRLKGKTRKQVYAALWANPRKYGALSFDIQKVYQYLSKVLFKRKTNANGSLYFYGQNVYVGTRHKRKIVDITFDVRKKCFSVSEEAEEVFGYFAADNFTEQSIRKLNVCRFRILRAET
jgi:hypothetical protein